MPNWKKVITSGSDASLHSLTVTAGITGSLFGTASYASSALSSSYALTASYASSALSSSYAATSSLSERTTQTDVMALNQTGFTLTKGMVVRITGSNNNSDIPRIATASYEDDPHSANTLGIVIQTITNGSQGYVITEGILTGIDTSNYVSGQLIYLGATGSITGSAPVAPLHTVRLGEVIRQQSNNGSIFVRIDNGYELRELHDVLDTSTNNSYGDLLIKSGSVWTNSKQLTGSYGLTGSLQASSFTGSLQGTSSWANNSISSSYSSTSSYVNTLNQNVLITGSLTVLQGATIYGSSSFQYITSSQLAVSASYISVNVFEPLQRFGGLYVYDSGSSNATASLTWDSLNDRWIYSNASGALYSSGMLLSGPRNTGSLGDEASLTKWFIPRSDGGDHLNNTQIFSSGSTHIVTGSLTITGGLTGSLNGTSSWSNNSTTSSYALTASYVQLAQTASYIQNAQTASYVLNAVSSSFASTASYIQLAQTASYVLNAVSSSFASTASYVQNAQTASYVQNAQTASYVLNAVSSSFASTASSVNRLTQDVIITGSLIVSSSNATQFQVGSRSLFISSSGNIGIGTILPTSSLHISGTTNLLTIQGSGSSSPLLSVIGSSGSIFTITDTSSGSAFSVTDLSNQPIFQVFPDGTSLMGNYQVPVLYTSTLINAVSGNNIIYSFSSSVYSSAYFDYNIRSGSNGRAGSIAMMWVDSSANFIETKTADFGSTSGFTFAAIVSGSNVLLTGSCSTSGWTIKTSVRAI